MLYIAEALGAAVFGCLLWWPVSFLAAKGSLGLTYRRQPFLLGWCISVVLSMISNATFTLGQFNENPVEAVFSSVIIIPIALCVFSAIVLRRRFVPDVSARPKTPCTSRIPTLLRTGISWVWNSFKHLPEAWLAGITLLGLFYAAVFPPWVFELRGSRLALGSGVIYDPPSYGGSDAYVHIDSGLLAAHCLGIATLGGIATLLAYVYRRRQPIQTTAPASLLDRSLDTAGKIIISGYRNLAAQHGCAPTQATSDQQIMEIYRKVGAAFKDVARERGEELQAGWMNTVVLKFFQVKEKLGEAFMDEHLSYELDKYRQGGCDLITGRTSVFFDISYLIRSVKRVRPPQPSAL
jgi:hypothetical protein